MLLAAGWTSWIGLFAPTSGQGARAREVPLVVRAPATVVLELGRGQVLWAGHGSRIRCDSGVLWITQGDGTDRVLAAGDALVVPRREPALLHALQDARFTIVPPHAD